MSLCWNDLSIHGPDAALDRFAALVGAPGGDLSTLALPVGRDGEEYLESVTGIVGAVECGREAGHLVYCFDTVAMPPDHWLAAVAAHWPELRFVLAYLVAANGRGGALVAAGTRRVRVYRPAPGPATVAFARDRFAYEGPMVASEVGHAPPPRRRAREDCGRPILRLVRQAAGRLVAGHPGHRYSGGRAHNNGGSDRGPPRYRDRTHTVAIEAGERLGDLRSHLPPIGHTPRRRWHSQTPDPPRYGAVVACGNADGHLTT